MSIQDVAASIAGVTGICEVHDLHVWSICSGHVALSAHVVVMRIPDQDERLMGVIKNLLNDRFGIEHTTIQFERAGCGQGEVNHRLSI
jgi:cobalt-zinc-cadmium efflux system protein